MNKLVEGVSNFSQDEINAITEVLDSIKRYLKNIYRSDIDSNLRSKIKNIIVV